MLGLIYKEIRMSVMLVSTVIFLCIMVLIAVIDPVKLLDSTDAEAAEINQLLGISLFSASVMIGVLYGFSTPTVGFSPLETIQQCRFYASSPLGIPGTLASKYLTNFIVTAGIFAVTLTANVLGRLIAPYKPDLSGLIIFCFSMFLINNALNLALASWFGTKKQGTAITTFFLLLLLVSLIWFLFGDISIILNMMFSDKETDSAELVQSLASSGLFRTLYVIITAAAALISFIISYFIGLPGYRRQIDKGAEN